MSNTVGKWNIGVGLSVMAGLLMPPGILSELYLGLPFYLVLVGAISIVAATLLLAFAVMRIKQV